MSGWSEVADGVLQRRYEPLDVSVCLVVGADELLLVDTRCNPREGAEIRRDVVEVSPLPLRHVVNTHAHYDHTFGNQAFATTARIYGHHRIPAHFEEHEGPRLDAWRADPAAQPHHAWHDVELVAPQVLVHDPVTVDLGGRAVHLLPLGPGHTDTDLVVHVPDASTWIVGDVVEESGPPMYGSGSHPFGWPGVLDDLAARIGPTDVVVPGHGAVVDRAFVLAQAATLGAVATGLRDGILAGTAHDEIVRLLCVTTGYPPEIIGPAVTRGACQLGR
ncbi:MBL fold metallo-hydrolase [Sanguibacter sp. 25GB23B1]|uniref:MBL fold metallo-hydrolase n=1 Tax=unclassified Sanguibacter TaxID=2645534 RepID=UPI0032AF4798